jgi:transcriptional regulator with XRE-family HTH domain
MSQRELATTSGVSQGQLSAILNDKSACSIETAEALARAFDLHGWHLLLHNLPKELVDSPKVGLMVDGYLKLNGEGREFIDAAIRRETSRKR